MKEEETVDDFPLWAVLTGWGVTILVWVVVIGLIYTICKILF